MTINAQEMKASQILITIAAIVIVVAGTRAATDILVSFLLAVFVSVIKCYAAILASAQRSSNLAGSHNCNSWNYDNRISNGLAGGIIRKRLFKQPSGL